MEDQIERANDKPDPNEPTPKTGQSINPQGAVPIPPPPPREGIVAPQGNAEDSDGHQANGQSAQNGEQKNRVDMSAMWMIVLTAIIAVATGLNVWIFYLESEATSKQIDKLTERAEGIVRAMNTDLSNNQDAISKAFKANQKAVEASNAQNQKSVNATLKAAADTNKIALQALEAQQRPWITESSRIGAPVDFNVNGAGITFLFTFENVGHTPAEKVWVEARLINIISSNMPSVEEHERVCNGPATTAPKKFTLGETLFPGKQLSWPLEWTIPWSEIQGTRAPNILAPLLYGCVEYSYGLSTARHSTPFRYSVAQSDSRALVQDGGFNGSTKEIAPSMLILRREGILGLPSPD